MESWSRFNVILSANMDEVRTCISVKLSSTRVAIGLFNAIATIMRAMITFTTAADSMNIDAMLV